MARRSVEDTSLLNAALEGLEAQKQRLEEQIQRVRAMLGGRRKANIGAGGEAPNERTGRKRQLSAAARKRIAMAQKRRWAEYRRKSASAKQ
jgi:hypothetical protein